ncbi:uncharacterized protein LOC129717062 [Wyeomyia smithii]|uniref:uncharacterized protein LOC129717062 n=1 Tax=Wyeomyia smithii TaxID=174621 RepID=UPI002467DD6B|nr:uncharacterized protein LOC129717062 [Wyeomyia smithii]
MGIVRSPIVSFRAAFFFNFDNQCCDQRKWPKYFQLFKASRNGIERLEISDSENDKNTRIVTLENCVKIIVEQSPVNIINVVTKTGQIQLHSSNDLLVKQWKVALQSVAFKEKPSQSGIVYHSTIIEEDNDLYCSSYSEGIFTVTLIPTNASIKCGLEPKLYTLMLSSSDILLKCYDDESFIVARWPYRFIRKYGYRDGKFTFEAGRMCDTGEGTFKLDNVNPQEIFRSMATIMKSMKNKVTNDTPSQSNQLNFALRMEAGSRSPLPPTIPDACIDMECQNSLQSVILTSDITTASNSSTNANCIIPCKPPRKTFKPSLNRTNCSKILPEERHRHSSNITSVFIQNFNSLENSKELAGQSSNSASLTHKSDREYECVKDITEAWKKLGIDDINHTEKVLNDELCSSREHHGNDLSDKSTTTFSYTKYSIFDETYDRLNFFRTTYKSSGYKTIVPINTQFTTQRFNVNVSDDYEIVGDPTISSNNHSFNSSELDSFDDNANHVSTGPDFLPCRKADDSYLGYGTIRRHNEIEQINNDIASTMPSSPTNNEVMENNSTQLTYSTAYKPKLV